MFWFGLVVQEMRLDTASLQFPDIFAAGVFIPLLEMIVVCGVGALRRRVSLGSKNGVLFKCVSKPKFFRLSKF